MADYPKKVAQVPTYNTFREQDVGKLPVLDVRNLGIDFGGLTAVTGEQDGGKAHFLQFIAYGNGVRRVDVDALNLRMLPEELPL